MTVIALKFTSSIVSLYIKLAQIYPALSRAVFTTYIRVFGWSLQSHLNIKQLRSIASQPCHDRQKSMEAIQSILDHATYNRDKALALSEQSAKLRYGTYLSVQLLTIAHDWDDLIIDLLISKDEEISESLTILSDAI